ncbi:MAG: hypothetical protein IIW17_04160 [Clostridia bacterium]|nr:hypothetical protein [Clostridia bacterium]
MSKIRALSLILCALLVLAFAACDKGNTEEQTTPEPTTEQMTEAPTEEPTTQEITTEQVTTEPETESLTEAETEPAYGGRDDFAEDDPNNPYYNLIAVGTSMDGMTTCYDGRYDFGYTVCVTDDGEEFSCIQDAIDYLAEWGGGVISMTDSTNVCLYLNIPQDGCFYRLAYNWHNVDFVFDHGAIYDDCTITDGVAGYAYYSDLYELDVYSNLEGTYVWVLAELEGLTPGRHLITDTPDPDTLFSYGYEKSEEVFEWPGLPSAEVLPE